MSQEQTVGGGLGGQGQTPPMGQDRTSAAAVFMWTDVHSGTPLWDGIPADMSRGVHRGCGVELEPLSCKI